MAFSPSKKQIIAYSVIIGIIIVGLLVALLLTMNKVSEKNSEMSGMVSQMNYEKQQLEQEYTDFAKSTDGIRLTNNDTLAHQITVQKQRIQALMEELRTVKATDAQRINALRNELATVRSVLRHYIAMADSLNQVNATLTTENKEVKQKYVQAAQTVDQLSKEKSTLTEKVERAARLEVRSMSVETLAEKGKKTDKVKKTALFKINFTIAKNVTAAAGNKTVYARILTPNSEVLSKSPNDVFAYENAMLRFSCKKLVEYQGDDFTDVLYWQVDEMLFPGAYRVDLFVDGNLIGQAGFKLVQ